MAVQGIPQGVPWPQDWPVPNYTNPPTRGTPALFIFTLGITAIVLALRLYSRCYLTRSLGIDDALVVAGFVLSLGQTYVSYKNLTTWGWNKHLWDVPITDHEHVRLGAWLMEFFFLLGIGCTKISILLVYRRISNGCSNFWFVQCTWAAIAFIVLYILALTLYLFLICHPWDSYWKSYSPTYTQPYRCGDERVAILLSVVLNVISDIYATLLPMFLVRKLRLSTKQRIGVTILFSVGILTVGTGVARIYFLDIVTINYKPGLHTHDVTWSGWPLYAWTDIEVHLAIICASAPALKVFFTKKLRTPLSRALSAPRSALSRSRSRTSSSKPLQSWPGFKSQRTNPSTTNPARNFTIEILHNPTQDELKTHTRDVEKFPLQEIVHLQNVKPLPALPTHSPPSPDPPRPISTTWPTCSSSISRPGDYDGGGYAYRTDSFNTISGSVSPASSSGDFLPIYLSGSLPPLVRRI